MESGLFSGYKWRFFMGSCSWEGSSLTNYKTHLQLQKRSTVLCWNFFVYRMHHEHLPHPSLSPLSPTVGSESIYPCYHYYITHHMHVPALTCIFTVSYTDCIYFLIHKYRRRIYIIIDADKTFLFESLARDQCLSINIITYPTNITLISVLMHGLYFLVRRFIVKPT